MRFVRKNDNRRKQCICSSEEMKHARQVWSEGNLGSVGCSHSMSHTKGSFAGLLVPQRCCGHSDSWVFRILGKSVKTQLTRCTYVMKSRKTILTQLLKQLKVVSRNRRLPGFCRMALSTGKGLGAWQCWLDLPSLLKRGYHSLRSHLSSKTCKLLRH